MYNIVSSPVPIVLTCSPITMTTHISLIMEAWGKAAGVSSSQDSPALASHETILILGLVLWRFSVFSFCTSERRPVKYTVDGENAEFCQDFLKQLAGVAHGTKGSHSKNPKPFRFGDQDLNTGSDTGRGRGSIQSFQPVFIVPPSSRTYEWGSKELY